MHAPLQEIPIQSLRKGEKGTVTSLAGDDCEVARLSALGIRRGVEVCALQNGGTCIFQYGCSRVCLRTAGQTKVMVARSR